MKKEIFTEINYLNILIHPFKSDHSESCLNWVLSAKHENK